MTAPKSTAYEEHEHLVVFMLVKTTAEWLTLNADQQSAVVNGVLAQLLETYGEEVRPRPFDSEFYSTRVTDVWMWEVKHRKAYEMIVEALRNSPLWDRLFSIIEVLPSVENTYPCRFEQDAASQ